MSYTLSAEIIGTKELQEAFDKAPNIVASAFKKAIAKSAFAVESKAKELAPIQYGFLRGSIHTQGPDVYKDNVVAVVGTNIKYAPYQEYGTGIYGGSGLITPKKAKVLAWKGRDGKWHFAKAVKGVKGKFYFKQAKEYAQPIMTKFISDALGEIVSSLAK